MDLLTSARIWANPGASVAASGPLNQDGSHTEDGHGEMPPLQRVVMFLSVVGPIAGLAAGIALLWMGSRIGWPEIWTMLVMYIVCGFGVTIGFHRLMTHRALDTYRPIRWVLAALGSAAGQGMAIRWCATHRRHHQRADRDGDPHSPHLHGSGAGGFLRGMYHAHVGWCFRADEADLARSVPDLLADRGLLLIDRLYFFWVGLGLLAPAAVLGLYSGSWQGFVAGLVWGGLVRICLMQHVTWSINSVCHVWGGRPYVSGDQSTNNMPIALLSFGEGWHNNHHAFPTSARHGLRWWQFDSSWVVICVMKWLRLAWDVRLPTAAALAAKAAGQAQERH